MTQLGKYQIIRKIGEGATSEVYLALDTSLNREVALKRLKPALVTDAVAFARFQKEARAAAVLFHYNIATVFEIGQVDASYYISMRYIKGKSLDKVLLEEGRQPWDEVLRMMGQLCEALDYAHKQGFLHRDIKPSNIIRGEDGQYVLTDFGLVRAMMTTGLSSHTGAMIGTPAYMAPEVWEGKKATTATDQYALACVIYEMLTGEVLFAGETPPAVMRAHFKPVKFPAEWTDDALGNIPEVLKTALADKVEDRFQDMLMFHKALSAPHDAETPAPDQEEKLVESKAESSVVIPSGIEESIGKYTSEAAQNMFSEPAAEGAYQDNPVVEEPSTIEEDERNTPGIFSAKRFWLWIGGLTGVSLLLLFIFYFLPRIIIKREVAEYKVGMVENMQSSIDQSQAMGIQTRDIDGMDMVYVPAGAFLMGSESGDDDEKPEHIVTLDGFWIDRYEVTNAQFAAFLNAQGNQEGWLDADAEDVRVHQSGGEWIPDSSYEDHPVVKVSWYGAQAYCTWAGGRLPTEAEWEKAARGTDGRTYPWGEFYPTCSHAQFGSCSRETVPVGSCPDGASPYGALDMSGNVWEWVGDWYDENYYIKPFVSNPTGPDSGDYRILRGGSWLDYERGLRASDRGRRDPGLTGYDFGFRCFLSEAP